MSAPAHPHQPWPPLVIVANVPRWMRWRDAVLTLLIWVLFACMLEVEFAALLGRHFARLGLNVFDSDANFLEFSGRLIPYLQTSVVLVALLFVAGLFTVRRRRRGRTLPAPPDLVLAEEARHAGLDEPALIYARSARIAVVHIDSDGGLRIETRTGAVVTTR